MQITAGTKEEIKIDPNCRDTIKACAYWAKKGFCELRRDFMLKDCKKSCNSCDAGIVLAKTAKSHGRLAMLPSCVGRGQHLMLNI